MNFSLHRLVKPAMDNKQGTYGTGQSHNVGKQYTYLPVLNISLICVVTVIVGLCYYDMRVRLNDIKANQAHQVLLFVSIQNVFEL